MAKGDVSSIGSDLQFTIAVKNKDGSARNLTGAAVAVYLVQGKNTVVKRYANVQVQNHVYGSLAINSPSTGVIALNVDKLVTAKMKPGDLHARVIVASDDTDFSLDQFQNESDYSYVCEMIAGQNLGIKLV